MTVDPKKIAILKAEAILISPNALGEKAEVVAEQACFLPISRSTGSPILTKLKEGVFFAAGHSCWGRFRFMSRIIRAPRLISNASHIQAYATVQLLAWQCQSGFSMARFLAAMSPC